MPNPLAIYQDTSNPLAAGTPTLADAADWHRQNLADAWSAARDPQTWQDAASQYGNALLGGSIAPEAKGLKLDAAAMQVLREMTPGFRAYHGSPHSFSQFDSAKIGTGEGAQAYGHGLYFADREGVAQSYRDALRGNPVDIAFKGQKFDPMQRADGMTPEQFSALQRFHEEKSTSLDDAVARWQDRIKFTNPDSYQRDVLQSDIATLSAIKDHVAVKPAGHMYEVQVNADPAHFLDWDKPLSEQHPKVQDAVLGVRYKGDREAIAASKADPDYMSRSIQSFYYDLQHPKITGSPAAASQALKDAGIPGIRYLDGGSRAGGEGSRNTVVFDPATIAILRKYGIAGLMAGGTAAASGGQSQ